MLSALSLQVQLQLLTAIVKLFLKKPTETQELVQQVLSLATQVVPIPLLLLISNQRSFISGSWSPSQVAYMRIDARVA